MLKVLNANRTSGQLSVVGHAMTLAVRYFLEKKPKEHQVPRGNSCSMEVMLAMFDASVFRARVALGGKNEVVVASASVIFLF